MIDALIYGITPRENTAQFSREPPLKILNRAAIPPPVCVFNWESNQCWSTDAFTPGHVIKAPTRTTTKRANVRRILERSSGIRNVFVNAEIMTGRQKEG
jgi:hypothetical protein